MQIKAEATDPLEGHVDGKDSLTEEEAFDATLSHALETLAEEVRSCTVGACIALYHARLKTALRLN